jgi:LacI family transcriptional regulator
VAKAVLAARLPTIALDLNQSQLSPTSPLSRLSEVCPDSHGAGRMAAEHLMERGFRHFAFVGAWGDAPWSVRRGEGFTERIDSAGLACTHFPMPKTTRDRRWGREQAILAQWLRSLPKPLGVLACDDDRGRQVLEACRAARLQVPEDVAVVGVDNDELLCELSDPTLSSVALNTEQAGYDAAALLDRLMSGRTRKPERILVAPSRVVARRSTDVHATEDRNLSKAVRFIHDNIVRPISVQDIVKHVDCSRRALELRFQRTLGRSVNQEIQLIRVERVKHLLAETDLSVNAIAEAVGFNSANYMIRLFRQKVGQSPTEYRDRVPKLGRLSFWQALNETPKLTPAQRRLGAVMRGESSTP